MKQLALFALNSFILPEGRMRLRVFEPRYQRLVSEASAGKRDFAIALVNPLVGKTHAERILPLATQVTIDDFEQLPDGLLGITISGVQKVQIQQRWQEADGLMVADTEALPHWPAQPLSTEYRALGIYLQQLLEQYPELSSLYPVPRCQDATWLASRFLELLPLPPALVQTLARQDISQPCLDSLQSWLATQA